MDHRGRPEASACTLSRSADGLASTIVWQCTEGRFNWSYDFDETILILEGSIVLENETLRPTRYGRGDVILFKDGAHAKWHVEGHVKKLAFCRKTQPAWRGFALRAIGKLRRMLLPADGQKAASLMGALAAAISGPPAPRAHFHNEPPVRASGRFAFAEPVKRIRGNPGKAPACVRAGFRRSFLDDVRSVRASDLLAEDVSRRIDPVNSPGLDGWIVDAERRAVPVACDRELGCSLSLRQPRNHPDVLDRTALQYPSKVDFARCVVAGAVGPVRGDLGVPASDEASVELKRIGAFGVRSLRM
jgi:uncharacterized protein